LAEYATLFHPTGWTYIEQKNPISDSQRKLVGWVEPFAKPIDPRIAIDGYHFAPPILRAAGASSFSVGDNRA
jgi:hypothetical protein